MGTTPDAYDVNGDGMCTYGESVAMPQSDCCNVDETRAEVFKKFCQNYNDDELYTTYVYYPEEGEGVCHRVATMRTVYFTTSEKETSVGEPDYYVLDSPTSMNDCCLNIDDYPDNG